MAKSFSKIALTGLAGLAAGLAIGLLVAPAKGSKTRKRLKKKLLEMEEKIQHSDLGEKFDNLKSIFMHDKEEEEDQDAKS